MRQLSRGWRRFVYHVLGGLVFLSPALASAQIVGQADEGIFTPPPTDVSVEYLRKIFGTVGETLSGGSNQLLGELFGIFNTAMLVFAGGFVMYSIGMSVISTAQDGQMMGSGGAQKMSTWMIFRIVGGSTMLVPKFNGYSFIQLLVMKAVLAGVGLADQVWNKAIDYVKNTGGFKVETSQLSETSDLKKLAAGIGVSGKATMADFYKAGVCLSAARRQARITSQEACIDGVCPRFDDTFTVYTGITCGGGNAYDVCFGSISKPTECGHYTWTAPSGVSVDDQRAVFSAVKQAARSVLTSSDILFSRAIDAADADVSCASSGAANNCSVSNSLVAVGSSYYASTLRARTKPPSTTATDWTVSAKSTGWIMAGSHYRNLVGGNARTDTTGGAPSYDSIDGFMYSQTKAPAGASTFPAVTVSSGRSVRDAYQAIDSAFSGYQDKTIELLSAIAGPAPAGGGASGVPGGMDEELDSLTHRFNQMLVVEPIFVGGTGNFRAKSMVTTIQNYGRAKLDIGKTNMMVMLRNLVAKIVGLGGQVTIPNHKAKGDPFADDKLTDQQFKYCKSACSSEAGCFASAVGAQCISYGAGILGGLAVDRGLLPPGASAGTSSDTVVRVDPLLGLAELGQTMMDQSVNYWMRTINDAFEIVRDLAVSYTTYMTLNAVGTTAVVAALYAKTIIGGVAAGQIAQFTVNTFNTIMKLFFQLDIASLQVFLPLGAAVALVMFTLGVSIGIYAPFIPFMLFLFGAIGWLASVVEAMVAAPLVALGVTHPEGHDLLGKSEQATMLLLGVFIRPVAMVIGLFVAILMSYIALSLLNYGFMHILVQYLEHTYEGAVGGTSKLIGMVGTLIVWVYVLLAVLNQVFSLIHQVPDKLLLWIGGPMGQSGTAQAMQQVQQGVQSTAQGAGQGASQTASQAPQVQPSEAKVGDFGKDKEAKGDAASSSGPTSGSAGGGGGGAGGGGSGGTKPA